MAKDMFIYTIQGRGKRWTCKCGAVLGVVPEGQRSPQRVLIFRHAQKPQPRNFYLELISVELRGTGLVHCSLCGRKRRWKEG